MPHADHSRTHPAGRRKFFFAILTLTRFALNLGFTQRPLLAALLWAGLSSSLQPALSLGIFFELLWLDLFPAGTFIPPQSLLALTTALTLLSCLPTADMCATALILVATLPLASFGAWVEQRYRTHQNKSYTALTSWNSRKGTHHYAPKKLICRAVGELFLLHFVLFGVSVAALLLFLRPMIVLLGNGPQPTWPMLWLVASLGALLALRRTKAYALGAAALLLLVLGSL